MPKVYAILPAVNAPAEKVVHSLMSLQRTNTPIVYVHRPEDQAPTGPDTTALECECLTLGAMLETIRREIETELFLWIPPGVTVLKDGLDAFSNAYMKNPRAALLVSDYYIDGNHARIHPLRDDLTEREDFGAVWGFPKWALEKIGGVDDNLKFTTFYDLRLKLAEVGELEHIPEPTHNVEPVKEENSDQSASLFFPGKGAYGGFSYLFMDPEEEKETEEVLYNCLKRRGAFLELPQNEITPSIVEDGDPIVTVVIPVHDRAKFLPMAIDSVLRGKLQNFEIIVVDNASTDNTREVAEEYAKKDPRIRVLASEVNLIARALNMGINEAKGKYIAQLDSDDEYTDITLESMVGHLETHPKCGLAISYYELMDEEGNSLEEFGIIEHLEYNINNIMRVDGAGAVRVWQKSAIREFGGFNDSDFPNYGEDYDLVLKVGEKYQVDRVHEVCYRYRRHPGNTDALRRAEDKIKAKTFARVSSIVRRRKINGYER